MNKLAIASSSTLTCLALATCGPPAHGIEASVRSLRDGVEAVENLPAALKQADAWTVDPTPELSIGVSRGPESSQLFRVMDAATVGERIAVVNAGTQELRWFDRDGAFLGSSGRRGEGPGEFRFPHRLWVRDDALLAVWDPALRRLSRFDREGSFIGSLVPDAAGGGEPDVAALFADGGFVLTEWLISVPDDGYAQSTLEVSLYSTEGKHTAALGSWPNGRMGRLAPGSAVGRYIFDATAHTTGTSDALWVGNGGDPEVVRFSPTGQRDIIVRWPAVDRPVEERHVDAYYEESAINDPEDAARDRELRSVRPVAERFPEYGALVAAESGDLWVMRYRPPGETGDVSWLVFADGGDLIAEASTPARFAPFEIGDDYLLGAGIDEGGFERVVLYRLRKSDGSGGD